MSNTLKFSELTDNTGGDLPSKEDKESIKIEIEVAGPKELITRTVRLSLDNRGLIKLNFQEGGIMPAILRGRFTDIENVKTALTVWQHREAKQYKLDEKVQHPKGEGQNISEIVDEAVQEGGSPGFEDKLDDALVADSEQQLMNSMDLDNPDDTGIVTLS